MSCVDFSTTPTNASAAQFRAWGKGLSDALTSVGVPRTSDTGQIDWATVAAPSATNTAQGYEIRRLNDSLQATHPVFIKIEFGSGTAIANPALWITLGTGSDGAGTLTGVLLARTLYTVTAVATPYGSFVAGAASRFLIAFCSGNPTTAGIAAQFILINLERTHSSVGADTADGVMFYSHISSTILASYLPFTGSAYSYAHAACVAPPTGTGAAGSNINTFMIRLFNPGETVPLNGMFVYFPADLTVNVPVSVATWDGSSHSYIPILFVNSYPAYGGNTSYLLRHD